MHRSCLPASAQVWDWGGHGCVRYEASDVGQPVIGYVAENLVLHTALLRSLGRPGSVPVFQPPVLPQSPGLMAAWNGERPAAAPC